MRLANLFHLKQKIFSNNIEERSRDRTSTSVAKPSSLQILVMYLMSRSGKIVAIKRMAYAPLVPTQQIYQVSTMNSLHNRGHCIFGSLTRITHTDQNITAFMCSTHQKIGNNTSLEKNLYSSISYCLYIIKTALWEKKLVRDYQMQLQHCS